MLYILKLKVAMTVIGFPDCGGSGLIATLMILLGSLALPTGKISGTD